VLFPSIDAIQNFFEIVSHFSCLNDLLHR